MNDRINRAASVFEKGFNCAQAVLSTYSSLFGLDPETALKISCGFGAGMGRMQETCGAVTGAFLLIGLKHGNIKGEDSQAKEKTYTLVNAFAHSFEQLYGSIKCRDIIGCDLGTPEGQQFYRENHLSSEKCVPCIKDAAVLVERLLFP